MRPPRYELMRPEEVVYERVRAPVAYVPLGPLEWHGPHLPMGVDMLHAHTMALEAAGHTGGVVLPPLPLGTETYIDANRLRHRGFHGHERVIGMDFPGFALSSLYVEESAMGVAVREVVRALKRQAFLVIVVVNGHGAPNHRQTLERIATEESEPPRVSILVAGALQDMRYRGHAELGETSYTVAYHPESVDLAALPSAPTPIHNLAYGVLDGPTCAGEPLPSFSVRDEQDPRRASAALGRADVADEARRIAARVRDALARSATGPL